MTKCETCRIPLTADYGKATECDDCRKIRRTPSDPERWSREAPDYEAWKSEQEAQNK